jgi:hypothetical protein
MFLLTWVSQNRYKQYIHYMYTRYINLDKRKQIPINYTCNIYIRTKEEQLLYTFGSPDLTPWQIFIILKHYRSSLDFFVYSFSIFKFKPPDILHPYFWLTFTEHTLHISPRFRDVVEIRTCISIKTTFISCSCRNITTATWN